MCHDLYFISLHENFLLNKCILISFISLVLLFSSMLKQGYTILFFEKNSFQAGEFFSSAKNSATAHQRELEVQNTFEGSIDNPLLLEMV